MSFYAILMLRHPVLLNSENITINYIAIEQYQNRKKNYIERSKLFDCHSELRALYECQCFSIVINLVTC